ncbi:unknown [Bacteroides cellulosilyticus CAG:158]|nr:unknown [Bacteroides cellulosilyticus CAG:158]
MVRSDVFVIFHHLINNTIRSQLDNTVGNGLYELVVMRREKDIALIRLQVIIECLDGLQIKMIGRSI